jgi:uncharacterized membrane protein required for colicin V production
MPAFGQRCRWRPHLRNERTGDAMLGRFTLLDWLIVGLPLAFAFVGWRRGAARTLLSGLGRILVSLLVAQVAVTVVLARFGPTLERIAAEHNLPPAWGLIGGGIATVVAVFALVGLAGKALVGALDATGPGRALDRLAGLPAGLLVGAALVLIAIVTPISQAPALGWRGTMPAEVRFSVLLPVAERFAGPLLEALKPRIETRAQR